MDHQRWTAHAARQAAYARQGTLCAKCWEPLGQPDDNWHAHHRLRKQLMPAGFEWCPCDIVALHGIPCHNQDPTSVHGSPELAEKLGLVLHLPADPRQVQLEVRWPWWGPAFLSCDGMVVSPWAG